MGKHLFDYEGGELLFTLDDNTAIDANGNMFMRVTDDFAVDLDSNELHFTSSWDSDYLSGDE